LLIRNLNENTINGLTNYIFTDNPKQIERFYAIFNDLDASVRFEPIPIAIHAGFIDSEMGAACYTDHQIFERYHRYKLRRGFTKDKALNLRMLRDLTPGDLVVHIDHGVGRFSGLEKLVINGHTQESVRLVYKNNDILYVGINSLHKLSKYSGKDGALPRLDKIGGDAWKNLKSRTKKKMKDMAESSSSSTLSARLRPDTPSRPTATSKMNSRPALSTKTPPTNSRPPTTSRKT
jgi:transcription-repair coupling factor (superfamily II helicase)